MSRPGPDVPIARQLYQGDTTLMGRSLPDRVQTCVTPIAHMSVENDWSSFRLFQSFPQSSNTNRAVSLKVALIAGLSAPWRHLAAPCSSLWPVRCGRQVAEKQRRCGLLRPVPAATRPSTPRNSQIHAALNHGDCQRILWRVFGEEGGFPGGSKGRWARDWGSGSLRSAPPHACRSARRSPPCFAPCLNRLFQDAERD